MSQHLLMCGGKRRTASECATAVSCGFGMATGTKRARRCAGLLQFHGRRTIAVGTAVGIVATCFNAPFDVVKSRFQSQLPHQRKYTGVFSTLATIYRCVQRMYFLVAGLFCAPDLSCLAAWLQGGGSKGDLQGLCPQGDSAGPRAEHRAHGLQAEPRIHGSRAAPAREIESVGAERRNPPGREPLLHLTLKLPYWGRVSRKM